MTRYGTTDTVSHPWLRAAGRWAMVAMGIFALALAGMLFALGGAF